MQGLSMKAAMLGCFLVVWAASTGLLRAETVVRLENRQMALIFDSKTGSLRSLANKLIQETYGIEGDEFAVEAVEWNMDFRDAKPVSLETGPREMKARYEHEHVRIEVVCTLGDNDSFAEKRMWLTPSRDCGLKQVVLSRPVFTADDLTLVCYRQPNFARLEAHVRSAFGADVKRPPGTEPVRTYFGRTPKGGFFTGIEMPFDTSTLEGRKVMLAYAPSLKVKAGERFACEPVYFGVYRRSAPDARAAEWRPADEAARTTSGTASAEILPLPSESEAMVAMTSAVLGLRRHRELTPMACGWHCQMLHGEYASDEAVEGEMKSLDFLTECGIDWLTDSHPWAGQTEKMNALKEGDAYELSPRVRRFLEHARKVGVKVVQWPTMNHTHPWSPAGRPFCADRKEWLRVPVARPLGLRVDQLRMTASNCLANGPFFDWITRIDSQALDTGYYRGWCMDGDFWGSGGYYDTTIPAECGSTQHDHLAPDSNYACQRALDRWIAAVRAKDPSIFVVMCRPPMDLGVWSQRNVDACFTLIETGSGQSNVIGGDDIRLASRIRLHHHFLPHYLDWPLLFPSFRPPDSKKQPAWPRGKIDYIMLSAMSCAPNLLLYLPTKTGMPAEDTAEIRKWLDWGRKNIDYLLVRRDLPDWPAPGKVDGSAHFVGDRGLVFLFNPGKAALKAEFTLTETELGLKGQGPFRIEQEYPSGGAAIQANHGQRVSWDVAPASAVVLCVQAVR